MRRYWLQLATVFIISVPSFGAIGFTGTPCGNFNATAVQTLSCTYSPTAGNWVAVTMSFNGTITSPSCADNNSHALTVLTAAQSTNVTVVVAYGQAQSGTTSYSCSWTTTRKCSIIVGEYTGVLGAGNTNTANGATNTSQTVTLTQGTSNSWGIAGCSVDAFATQSAQTNNNLRKSQTGASGNANSTALVDSSVTSGGSFTLGTTTSPGHNFACAAVEFKPSGAAAACQSSMTMLGVSDCG